MFNYHNLVILIHLLLFLWVDFSPREQRVREGADGISAILFLLSLPLFLCSSSPCSHQLLFIQPTRGSVLRSLTGFDPYLAFKSGAACV